MLNALLNARETIKAQLASCPDWRRRHGLTIQLHDCDRAALDVASERLRWLDARCDRPFASDRLMAHNLGETRVIRGIVDSLIDEWNEES